MEVEGEIVTNDLGDGFVLFSSTVFKFFLFFFYKDFTPPFKINLFLLLLLSFAHHIKLSFTQFTNKLYSGQCTSMDFRAELDSPTELSGPRPELQTALVVLYEFCIHFHTVEEL